MQEVKGNRVEVKDGTRRRARKREKVMVPSTEGDRLEYIRLRKDYAEHRQERRERDPV